MVALLTPVLLTGLLTACGKEGTADMEQMPQDQATTRVKQLAEKVRAASGADAFSKGSETVSPCDGKAGDLSDPDKVYYIQGIYQLRTPVAQQKTLFADVRQQLVADGMKITDERTFDDGGGDLGASRDDGYKVSLRSGEDPLIAVLVSSPCYRTP
jgi:hypothetical protein